ncbi:hypothetical protein [Lujinxingia litoralis]|uniref:hypothetical protein n=1 Tax=Lujinxingia litoralis TaxID=2211119 RepID=UPI001314DD1E|nr:hypothetical protein [Lujinxingia litoralis]
MGRGAALVGSMALLGLSGACSEPATPVVAERPVRGVTPELAQRLVLPDSRLRVRLIGTDRLVADRARVLLKGQVEGGDAFDAELDVELKREGDVGELYVELEAAALFWPQAPSSEEWFARVSIAVSLGDELGEVAHGELRELRLHFVRELAPELAVVGEAPSFVNGSVRLEGEGMLRPEEGQTWAVVVAGEVSSTPGGPRDLSGERLPVRWMGERSAGELRLEPGVFGVHPGSYQVTMRLENVSANGEPRVVGSSELTLAGALQPTFIASLSPQGASRGQWVELRGRGFVGAGQGYGMILRYEGVFEPRDPSRPTRNLEGARALERAADQVRSDELLLQEVWYSVEGRDLLGLGAEPGTFEGTISPLLYDVHGETVGVAWSGRFEVLPTRQVVWLKYLPAFTRALESFGLGNVEREIRDRILAVAQRDYQGVNMVFVEEEPEDFAAYAVVEIGGPDPSGHQAFGYDNTFNDQAKDTGNLYLNDYLGGINRQSGEAFNVLFGGVFVESFTFYSPTLTPGNRAASAHFDRVFGPFMPGLGGVPVRGSEVGSGERAQAIEEAVRVAGNVVGNTLVHEVGHSLGLTHLVQDWEEPTMVFHNPEPGGFIMDAGADRSFEQRAELEGEGPAVFNPQNRAYLQTILPLD